MISIAIIEDNRLMREGITALLNQTTRCTVVAASAAADLPLLQSLEPQAILLDLGLRNGDSLAVAAMLRTELPSARVIVMDLLPMHEELAAFVNAGVSGFIPKDATLAEMVQTIQAVVEGRNVLPPEMTSSLFSQIAKDTVEQAGPISSDTAKLTPRELEIIALIAEGLSNKGIAKRLGIASQTVKSHLRNIMEKLTLHSRLQIAAYVHNKG